MSTPETEADSPAAPARRLRWAWRVAWVRLRFLAVVGLAFAAVAAWEAVRNRWDWLARAALGGGGAEAQAVSGDTEYFCPMDPGVVSDWPGKCPICNMALVRRARGDAAPLPDGVLARMQFSPYRVQLGGIRTAPVAYRPLAREVEAPGRVGPGGEVVLDVLARDAEGVAPSQAAEVRDDQAGPIAARVESVEDVGNDGVCQVHLSLSDGARALPKGRPVRGVVRVPIVALEPFRSLAVPPPPLRPGEPRRAYECADHPEVVRERPGTCPRDGRPLDRRDLAANERLRWWCPMLPRVTADATGSTCDACGGMVQVPRVARFNPPGEVLALPESAVVDTGTRSVVYVERMPGMFDGVEVAVGPRCGDAYPVVRGVELGQRVVAVGAFLVDAETRLNPAVAASYFGAARTEGPAAAPAPAGRTGADAQKDCPVTGKALGSMGPPFRVELGGRVVLLCCEGCEPKLRKDPARYLAKLPAADPARHGP